METSQVRIVAESCCKGELNERDLYSVDGQDEWDMAKEEVDGLRVYIRTSKMLSPDNVFDRVYRITTFADEGTVNESDSPGGKLSD